MKKLERVRPRFPVRTEDQKSANRIVIANSCHPALNLVRKRCMELGIDLEIASFGKPWRKDTRDTLDPEEALRFLQDRIDATNGGTLARTKAGNESDSD